MTERPAGVPWCGDGPRKVPPSFSQPDPANEIIPAEIVQPCNWSLLAKDPALTKEAWRGSVVFGLTTNKLGELTDVCLWGGNFGNPTPWVECVVEKLKARHLILPWDSGQKEWTLTFVNED
jgi:hypothetical protein